MTNPKKLPHTETLQNAQKYIYFAILWISLDPNRKDKMFVFIIRQEKDICQKTITLNTVSKQGLHNPEDIIFLSEEPIECSLFNTYLDKLVYYGVMDIPDQTENYSTALFATVVGVQTTSGTSNWYSLVGLSHHTDPRHQDLILPFFRNTIGIDDYIHQW